VRWFVFHTTVRPRQGRRLFFSRYRGLHPRLFTWFASSERRSRAAEPVRGQIALGRPRSGPT
jgi:hypothetical protein